MMTNETLRKINELKLFGMAHAFSTQLETSAASHLSFEERIGMIVDHEITYRDDRRLQRLLKQAKLREPSARMEDVDYQSARGLDRSLISSLSLCTWIKQATNILITGPTGVGKTWIACAFAMQACRNGMTVKFERAPLLLEDLSLARTQQTFRSRIQAIEKFDLLVLDDFGINALTPSSRSDLLEVVECRSAKASTIVTSQLPVSRWHDYLGDSNPTVADAILDRVTSSAVRIALKGESLRAKKGKSESAR